LRERQDQPAFCAIWRWISHRATTIVLLVATIELPKELVADAAEFQLGLLSAAQLLPGVKRLMAEANLDQGVPVALDIGAWASGKEPDWIAARGSATDFPELPAEPRKSQYTGAG
jgi:hypothetical protein